MFLFHLSSITVVPFIPVSINIWIILRLSNMDLIVSCPALWGHTFTDCFSVPQSIQVLNLNFKVPHYDTLLYMPDFLQGHVTTVALVRVWSVIALMLYSLWAHWISSRSSWEIICFDRHLGSTVSFFKILF